MAAHPLLQLARQAIAVAAQGGDPKQDVAIGHRSARQACFVSLHAGSRLRGCIGTLLPTQPCVEMEVVANAVAAANRDPRFPPVRPEEVAGLHVSIDLLDAPEGVGSPAGLDPSTWGLIVREGGKSGVLLPDIPGVRTVQQQIDICREKAGIAPDAPIRMERFRVHRLEE